MLNDTAPDNARTYLVRLDRPRTAPALVVQASGPIAALRAAGARLGAVVTTPPPVEYLGAEVEAMTAAARRWLPRARAEELARNVATASVGSDAPVAELAERMLEHRWLHFGLPLLAAQIPSCAAAMQRAWIEARSGLHAVTRREVVRELVDAGVEPSLLALVARKDGAA